MKYLVIILLMTALVTGIQAAPCNTYLSTLSDKSVFEYGDMITFRCIVFNTDWIDISKLSLINLQTKVSTLFHNATGNTSYANIGVYSSNITGQYSCRYGNCSQDTLLSIIHVGVDHCSIPVQFDVRPSIDCIVNDISSMVCRWSTVQTVDDCGSWRAMYSARVLAHYVCCEDHVTATSVDACAESGLLCVVPVIDLFLGFTYTFVLSRITTRGEEIYNYTIFAGNNIVRVDIDEDVHVQPGSGPRDLHVTFTVHHSPASVQGLICNLTYISQWDNHFTEVVHIEQISLDVDVTVNRLIPYTMYTVNVTCRPTTSPYWSNHVTGSGRTSPTAPDSSPDLIGYSTQMTSHNLTQICLYLRSVPMCDWYDEELSYVVTMDDDDVVVVDTFDGDTVTAELLHQVSANKTYTVMLHSENEAGGSKMVEYLNLTTNVSTGTFVAVEEEVGGSIVILFQNDDDNITGVTYFRCQGQPNTYPPVCAKELHNKTVSRFMHSFFWSREPTTVSVYTWYYGVTIHRQTEYDDRHIVWSDCVFPATKIARDTTLDVSAMFDPVNSSFVMVTLHFDYCALRQRPIQYLIGVWNSLTNITEYCNHQHSEFQSFTASPSINRLNVSVHDLTNPMLCVRVQYEDGFDLSEGIVPQYSTNFLQSDIATSVKTLNITYIATAVVASVIASVVLAIFVVMIRRFRRQQLNNNIIPRRVMTNILESAPQVFENIQQYTAAVAPINSSGYESLEMHVNADVMFTNSFETNQYSPVDGASNSDSSVLAPTLNYTQISHRESTVHTSSGMDDMTVDTVHRNEIDNDVCGNSNSSSGNKPTLNYIQIQASDSSDNGSNADSNDYGGQVGVKYEQAKENDDVDCSAPVLNYIQVAYDEDTEECDVEMGIEEEGCDTDRKIIQLTNPEHNSDSEIIAHDADDAFSVTVMGMVEPNTSEYSSGVVFPTSDSNLSENSDTCSNDIDDEADDGDVIDSYSQFTTHSEISSDYAIANIMNSSSC